MSGTPIAIGFFPGSQSPVDERYLNDGVSYASTSAVLANIPLISRHPYLIVNIAGVLYWFSDPSDLTVLTPVIGTITILDGSVTLIKMADVASGTVFYRKSAGLGIPEVQTLATLKTDLGVPDDPTAALALKVDKITGYTLLSPEQAASITANTGDETEATIKTKLGITTISGSNTGDQDLSGLQPAVSGKGLSTNDYSDAEKAKVAALSPFIYRIEMTATGDVAARCAGTVAVTLNEIAVDPAWTLAADSIPEDLKITHNLNRHIADANVFYIDGTDIVKLPINDGYSVLIEKSKDEIILKDLTLIGKSIVINLIFS